MMNRKLMYTALSASLLLAACGTDSADEETNSAGVEDPAETVNTDTEGTGADTNADSENQPAEGENTESEGITEDEADETDDGTEGETEEEEDSSAALSDGSETESDEQDFKMQVLPGYELMSEEPGRDVLAVNDHPDLFMSIETADTADADYDKALEMMNEKLAASSSDSAPVELTEEDQLPSDTSLEKVQAYRVKAAQGPITAIIFQKEDMIVTVTMYDNHDEEFYSDYLQMAESIELKN